jgi:hypothetical protein
LVVLASTVCVGGAWATSATAGDTARYILAPGNYGGVPFTRNSTDQLPLYSRLTPLRGR